MNKITYISPKDFSERHCALKKMFKNSSPNTSLYRSIDNKLVKKIIFYGEDEFRQWIQCLEFEIERQNDQGKLYPQHVFSILDHTYEKKYHEKGDKFKFYITYDCNPEKMKSLFNDKSDQIKKTLKILQIGMMLKSSGICHNNIKPSNLIVYYNEKTKENDIMLTDYGSTRTHYRNYYKYSDTFSKDWQNDYLFYQCFEYQFSKDDKSNFEKNIKPDNIEPDIWALGIIILQIFSHESTSQKLQYFINQKGLENKIKLIRLQKNAKGVADALQSLLINNKYDLNQIFFNIQKTNNKYISQTTQYKVGKKYPPELFYTSELRKIKDTTRQFNFNRRNFMPTKFKILVHQTTNESGEKSLYRMSSNDLEQFIPNYKQQSSSKQYDQSFAQSLDDQFININQQIDKLEEKVESIIELDQIGESQIPNEDTSQNKNSQQNESKQIINSENVQVSLEDKDKNYLITIQEFKELGNKQEHLAILFEKSLSEDMKTQIEHQSSLNNILENLFEPADSTLFFYSDLKLNECSELYNLSLFMIQEAELYIPIKYFHYLKRFSDQIYEAQYQGYILNNKYHGLGRLKKNSKIFQGIFHQGQYLWGSSFEMVDDVDQNKIQNLFIKKTGTFFKDLLHGEECEILQYEQKVDENFELIDSYRGGVREDVIHGKGAYINKQQKYYGEWEKGEKQGYGSQRMIGTTNEFLYIGEFKNDKFDGFGIKSYGSCFSQGQYKNGRPIGEHIEKTEFKIRKLNHDQICPLF